MLKVIAALGLILSAPPSAEPQSAEQPMTMCWSAGDWIGVYEFHPGGKVLVTVYDDYLISSEQFTGSASFGLDKVTVHWSDSTEEFDYDRDSSRVLPPKGESTEGCSSVLPMGPNNSFKPNPLRGSA